MMDMDLNASMMSPGQADSWWDIQSSLPEVLNAVPFAFIIYTNKTKLSSFGTAKGYPVVIFPLHIMRNTNAHAQHSCTEGEKVLKALRLWPIHNVFWLICNSDLYGALSFDHLHFLHGGLWGKHILQDILRILNVLGHNAETNVKNYVSNFPQWWLLFHFKNVINVTFSDGNKMCDLAKAMFYALLNVFTRTATPEGYCLLCILASYLQLDSLIGLDMHTERTIEMIDAELLKFNNKLRAYIECVNKSGLEGLWVDWDFPKILHVDKHKLAAKLLRMHVNNYKNWTQMQGEPAGTEGECNDNQSGLFMAFDHVYLGSSSKPSTIQDIEASCSVSDTVFITEYRYLKVNYKSSVDWKVVTDHLQCNLSFYGQPQYDCTLIQLMETDTAFVHLISIFTCNIHGVGSISLAFIQPLTAKVGGTCQIDIDLWLICIQAAPCNNPIFIPIQSILCGAVVAPDPSCPVI
ncbi:hypothetical protein F5J12DRAFT_936001 [Pisolithus orientalis]|uniref:uncharacterized protein n=1 Tax=Pisolithus orientalis TaxID=936130 RepID=UPI0022243494|nr:uncharacterized protein F5J12DRAFT_936001 [Pisolithus orientalis]KAI6008905.1 hypothetical protein F5J12DRAFT_936001 [Pisolithus orientalis]